MQFQGGEKCGMQMRGRKKREDVFEENARCGKVGVLSYSVLQLFLECG